MNKKEFEQFLDTGWHSDATLYLNGRIYWCEGLINSKTGMFEFSVESWDVEIINELYFKSITTKDGKRKNYKVVYECIVKDPDTAKKQFLEAKIFDGKSFWETEHELRWLEE